MFGSLNRAEKQLATDIVKSIDVTLKAPHNVLRAGILRAFILRLSDGVVPSSLLESNCPRWVIRGAEIDGRLYLRDARLPGGGPLPALEFIGCNFIGGFNAASAHFERLRFEDCTFDVIGDDPSTGVRGSTPLVLRNVTIDTELRLRGVRALREDGLFWMFAWGLRTGNNIRIAETTFRAPKRELPDRNGLSRNALDLTGAEIRGELMLGPKVRCYGGVKMRSARVMGDVWAVGLLSTDGEDEESRASIPDYAGRYAFSAQAAEIKGNLTLRMIREIGAERTILQGHLHLWGIKVDGTIDLRGVYVQRTQVKTAEGMVPRDSWVQISFARVGADLTMDRVEFSVSSLPINIEGGLIMTGAIVHGTVTFNGKSGSLQLDNTTVDGNVLIRGTLAGLQAIALNVGADAQVWPRLTRLEGAPTTVDLRRCSVKGSLDLSHLEFSPGDRTGLQQRLLLRGTEVGKSLLIALYPPRFLDAREIKLKCFPGFSLIEARFAKRDETAGERVLWGGESVAYARFLFRRKGTTSDEGDAAVHFGEPLYELSNDGSLKARTPFQILAQEGLAKRKSDNDEELADYIRFACSIGFDEDKDSLSIAEYSKDLPPSLKNCKVTPIKFVEERDELRWTDLDGESKTAEIPRVKIFHCFLRQGGEIEEAEIQLIENGFIYSKTLSTLPDVEVVESLHYEPPFRFGDDASRPAYGVESDYERLSRADFERRIPLWREILAAPERLDGVKIDVRDAVCGNLQDEGGVAWQGARKLLENFVYNRIVSQTSLRSEESRGEELATRKEFLQQPYSEQFLAIRKAAEHILRVASLKEDKALFEEVRKVTEPWLSNQRKQSQLSDMPVKELLEATTRVQPESLAFVEDVCAAPGMILEPFHPQPYQQLAKVWREQGNEDGARKIEQEKMRIESEQRIAARRAEQRLEWKKISTSLRPFKAGSLIRFSEGVVRWIGCISTWIGNVLWRLLYGYGFGYCLEVPRTIITLCVFYCIGWAGVYELGVQGYMTATTLPVASMVTETKDGLNTPVFERTIEKEPIDTIACGSSINALLYAVETFTPLINLHQTARCDIRSPKDEHTIFPKWLDMHLWDGRPSKPRIFEFLKAFYEACGYLVWSLAVLTFSGVARRWEQE